MVVARSPPSGMGVLVILCSFVLIVLFTAPGFLPYTHAPVILHRLCSCVYLIIVILFALRFVHLHIYVINMKRSTRLNPDQIIASASVTPSSSASVTPSAPTLPSDKMLFSKEEIDALVARAVEDAIRSVTALFNQKMDELNEKCAAQEDEINYLKERMKKMELAHNHLEQYSRRSHLRIKGLHLDSSTDCKTAVASFINSHLKDKDGIPFAVSKSDMDAAHTLPSRRPSLRRSDEVSDAVPPPPTIIVRFHSRDMRDAIIRSRRQLKEKEKRVSITEDLTSKNAKLVADLKKIPGVEASWSWGGKVYAKHSGSSHPKRYDIFDL